MTIIAFANLSGNSGKTTISSALASVSELPLIRIESMNSTFAAADIQIESRNNIIDAIGTIHSFKDIGQSAIVDIGSSDLGHIFSEIDTEYNSFKELIDFWVIPCVNEIKQISDTKRTILKICDANIPPQKIVVVFNRISGDENLKNLSSIVNESKVAGYFVATQYIGKFSLFDLMNSDKTSITEILSKNFDMKEQIEKATKDKNWKEVTRLGKLKEIKNMANTISQNLKEVFESTPIFKNENS